ncbi:MAG: hypothetical protein AUG51_14455 [Acidobacteria bacterium 13_1_20CM_3_53_8]|nr:MAG: hypothetical protein AUG51_14455 [Acidobacteria bacterium 13_1_20CM_3_53_8]
MSLFGMQQMLNLTNPSKATKAFDNVTETTKEQFGDIMKATFRAGDNIQRGIVDLTLGVFTGQAFNPNQWTRMTSDALRQSADAVSQGMQGAANTAWQAASGATPQDARTTASNAPGTDAASGSAQRQSTGWGPMPSANAASNSRR